jgi:hypothetical protein
MPMLAFSDAVLLGGVRTRNTMGYPRALKIMMEFMIFATPIGLNCLDLSI